jgi:pyrroline-5-carboxylate reductase
MKTISFIGSGRVTRFMLKGLSRKGLVSDLFTVYDISEEARDRMKSSFPGTRVVTDLSEALKADIVVLALTPKAIMESAEALKQGISSESFILSLSPKLKLGKVMELLGVTRAARMNPSAPSVVNRGFNPVSFSAASTDMDRAALTNAFGALGEMPEVEDQLIDAFAVVSAMGYTYFDYQFATLSSLAKEFGIPDDLVRRSILALAGGAAETVVNGNLGDETFDLVPARPLKEIEDTVKSAMKTKLTETFKTLAG